jgi:hypothetical protein
MGRDCKGASEMMLDGGFGVVRNRVSSRRLRDEIDLRFGGSSAAAPNVDDEFGGIDIPLQ